MVQASQGEFLSLVAVGCFIVALAIIPLSIEGGYAYERDAITLEETTDPNPEIQRVDAACQSIPWLVCIGFVLIYSALIAKLNRIKEIMKQSLNFRRVQVKRSKVAITMAILLSIQIIILLTWQLHDPLQWERTVTERDSDTNYPTASIGRCTSDHSKAYGAACGAFVALCLVYALVLAWQTRKLPVEFSESTYIALSVSVNSLFLFAATLVRK